MIERNVTASPAPSPGRDGRTRLGATCLHRMACIRVIAREHPHVIPAEDADDLLACTSCPLWRDGAERVTRG